MTQRSTSRAIVLVLIMTVILVGAGVAVVVGMTLQNQQAAPTDSGAFLDDASFVTPAVVDETGNSPVYYVSQQSIIDANNKAWYRFCNINEDGFITMDCSIWNGPVTVVLPNESSKLLDVGDYEFITANGVKKGGQSLLYEGNKFYYRQCTTTNGTPTDKPLFGDDCEDWIGPISVDYTKISGKTGSANAVSIGQYSYLASDGKLYTGNSWVFDEGGQFTGYYKRCPISEDGNGWNLCDESTWYEVKLSNLDITVNGTTFSLEDFNTYGAYVTQDKNGNNVLTQSIVANSGRDGFYRICTIDDKGGYGGTSLIPGENFGKTCDDNVWAGPVRFEEFTDAQVLGYSGFTLEYRTPPDSFLGPVVPQGELPALCSKDPYASISPSNQKVVEENGVKKSCITLNNNSLNPVTIDGGIEMHQCTIGVNQCAGLCIQNDGVATLNQTTIVPANGSTEVCLPLSEQGECGLLQWDFYGTNLGGNPPKEWCARAPNNTDFDPINNPYPTSNPYPDCFGWTVLLGTNCPAPIRTPTPTQVTPQISPTPTPVTPVPSGVTPTPTANPTLPPPTGNPTPTPTKAPVLPDTFISTDLIFYIGISLMTLPPALSILYVRRLNSRV